MYVACVATWMPLPFVRTMHDKPGSVFGHQCVQSAMIAAQAGQLLHCVVSEELCMRQQRPLQATDMYGLYASCSHHSLGLTPTLSSQQCKQAEASSLQVKPEQACSMLTACYQGTTYPGRELRTAAMLHTSCYSQHSSLLLQSLCLKRPKFCQHLLSVSSLACVACIQSSFSVHYRCIAQELLRCPQSIRYIS